MKIRIVAWWLALAAFAVCGGKVWIGSFLADAPTFQNPDTALDGLAKERFGMEHGAAVLRREIASLAPDAPLLVFGPGNDWTLTEAHFLISYLAWPRPVWCVGVMPPRQKASYDWPPPPGIHPSALFFYRMDLPPAMPARQLSPALALRNTQP